jgi:hypothetical protein
METVYCGPRAIMNVTGQCLETIKDKINKMFRNAPCDAPITGMSTVEISEVLRAFGVNSVVNLPDNIDDILEILDADMNNTEIAHHLMMDLYQWDERADKNKTYIVLISQIAGSKHFITVKGGKIKDYKHDHVPVSNSTYVCKKVVLDIEIINYG